MLEHLKPERVFYYFEKMCEIPHGSGNTKQISDFCVDFAKEQGLDPATKEAKVKMLELLQEEVNMYRKGGRMFGAFPERWLPAAVCVLPEPWTEQNHFLNSSMKVVRGRVEEAYKAHMEFAYTPEGKNIVNDMNLASL